MHLPYELICIDLETTSADRNKGSIVQLSAVLVNQSFEPIPGAVFNEYIKPLDSFRDSSAMRIHEISESTLKIAPQLEEVLEMFENFCDKTKVLAAWGNYFDVPFLFKQYEKIGRKNPFAKKSIDLKSIAIWERAKEDIGIPGGIKKFLNSLDKDFEGVQHDALDDIKNTIELLRILKSRN
jgi:DNA polymerase III alpha subunit (gram-positive type)